jgi:hypothetical protein
MFRHAQDFEVFGPVVQFVAVLVVDVLGASQRTTEVRLHDQAMLEPVPCAAIVAADPDVPIAIRCDVGATHPATVSLLGGWGSFGETDLHIFATGGALGLGDLHDMKSTRVRT